MKKFYAVFIVLLSFTLLWVQTTYANENELPQNQNYLNLSNLEMIPGYSKMAKTVNPIYVIPQTTYTVELRFIGMKYGWVQLFKKSPVSREVNGITKQSGF